ncbi:MAG: hypothetical protein MZW92_26385 [Comamonadaceae bacterium]|nr:hypothetical protein [Comamonadaceae bacterium]
MVIGARRADPARPARQAARAERRDAAAPGARLHAADAACRQPRRFLRIRAAVDPGAPPRQRGTDGSAAWRVPDGGLAARGPRRLERRSPHCPAPHRLHPGCPARRADWPRWPCFRRSRGSAGAPPTRSRHGCRRRSPPRRRRPSPGSRARSTSSPGAGGRPPPSGRSCWRASPRRATAISCAGIWR